MPVPSPATLFLQFLHRALRDQAQQAQARQCQQSLAALEGILPYLLQDQGPVELRVADQGFLFQGRAVLGAAEAARALARELQQRAMGGLSFQAGMDPGDLRTLLFVLQLEPRRLAEMGGATRLLPDDGSLRVLAKAAPPPPAPSPANPELPLELDWNDVFARIPPWPLRNPPEAPPRPSAEAVQSSLRALIQEALAGARATLPAGPRSPWGIDQRESLERFGFRWPSFRNLEGAGARLGLATLGPASLREALRKILAGLDPQEQGHVLLGLPTFPPGEPELRRALDALAPDVLGRTVARIWLQHRPTLFELPLLAKALLQTVPDREPALEAIRARLRFEGWSGPDLEALEQAIHWECQGTDTKLQVSLRGHGVRRLDARMVKVLGHSLCRSGRLEDLALLLGQLEEELRSPKEARRRHGAEILADLAAGLPPAGLPLAFETRLLAAAQAGLATGTEPRAAQWCAQAVEALVGHWILRGRAREVHAALREMRNLVQAPAPPGPGEPQLLADLLTRLIAMAKAAGLMTKPAADPVFSIYRAPSPPDEPPG